LKGFPGSRGSREFKSISIASMKGIPIDAIPILKQELLDVDLAATIRASVAYNPTAPIPINPHHARVRVRKERIPVLHVILLDASGSIVAGKRISVVKYIIKRLVEEAYTKRVYVSLITFRGSSATTLAWPMRNFREVYNNIDEIPLGGSTPFTMGLLEALKHIKMFREKFRKCREAVHIVTDGRANVFLSKNPKREVLDIAEEFKKLGVKVIAYHIQQQRPMSLPDYLSLFINTVGGKYIKV